jgi:hypothetical protein
MGPQGAAARALLLPSPQLKAALMAAIEVLPAACTTAPSLCSNQPIESVRSGGALTSLPCCLIGNAGSWAMLLCVGIMSGCCLVVFCCHGACLCFIIRL